MQWFYISILLLMMAWFDLSIAPVAQGAAHLSELETKQRELNQLLLQLQQSQQQLRRQQREEQSILDRLDTISRRQATVARNVHVKTQALMAAQERRVALQAAHHRLSDQLAQQRQRLRQRVRQLYKLVQLPYIKLLLSAKDVAEFSRKVQYIQHLAVHDRQQLDQYHLRRKQLASTQSELALATQRTQAVYARLKDQRQALAHERQRQASLLGSGLG